MRFGSDDDADSSQVEDRRGSSFGGPLIFGGGGLGLVGVVAYVLIRVLGGNVSLDSRGGPGAAPPVESAPNQALGGSCAGVTSDSDPAKFISCVVSNVQRFWGRELSRRGVAYEPAHLVLFSEATPSGCGTASAATGPFYCPRDGKVYLDLGFFAELRRRFHARGGDFAEAYVVAHEYGHHIQDLLGVERKVRMAEQRDPSRANALSVRLELQADCFAGVWGHAAYDKGTVDSHEVAQALDAAAAVGDDRIQKEVQGRVRPETFTHGSAAERQRWFSTGMRTGDVDACDTFAQP
jgi:predicted metalloprotease